jgi:hypothetical protein
VVTDPGCKGPCEQGRHACPHPQACELADEPDFYGRDWFRGVVIDALLTGAAVGCVLFAVLAVHWVVTR